MLATIVSFLAAAAPAPPDTPIVQPLVEFAAICDATGERRVHHLTFATAGPNGRAEDRLELRTTFAPGGRAVAFLVNGETIAVTEGDTLTLTPAGREWLAAVGEVRAVEVLNAFAVAVPRGFIEDLTAPTRCDELAGKAEQVAKCGLIGILGTLAPHRFVRLASALASGLCVYLVTKVCDENPDSCEDHPPGWTEG